MASSFANSMSGALERLACTEQMSTESLEPPLERSSSGRDDIMFLEHRLLTESERTLLRFAIWAAVSGFLEVRE